MNKTIAVSLLVLWPSFGATQGAKRNQVAIHAPGTSSCGTWLEARQAQRAGHVQDIRVQQFEAFLAGYVSAYNTHVSKSGNVLGSLDAAGYRGFLDKWCGENPTDMVVTAVGSLILHMEAR